MRAGGEQRSQLAVTNFRSLDVLSVRTSDVFLLENKKNTKARHILQTATWQCKVLPVRKVWQATIGAAHIKITALKKKKYTFQFSFFYGAEEAQDFFDFFFLRVSFFLPLQVLPGRAEEEDVLSLGQVNHLSFQPQTADLHPRQLVLILYGLHVQQALLSGSTSRA